MIKLKVLLFSLIGVSASIPASAELLVFDVFTESFVDDGILDFFSDYTELDQCSIEVDDGAVQPNARISFQSTDFISMSCNFEGSAATYFFLYSGPNSADVYEADLSTNPGDFGLQFDGNGEFQRVYGVTPQGDEIQTGRIGFYDSNGDLNRVGSSTSYFSFGISTGDNNPRVVLLEPATIFGVEQQVGSIFRADDVPGGVEIRRLNGTFEFQEGSTTPEGDPIRPTVDLAGFVSFDATPAERKLAIVYINGILTGEEDAFTQARFLTNVLFFDLRLPDQTEFYYFHNPSWGLLDFSEVIDLKLREFLQLPESEDIDLNNRDLLMSRPEIPEDFRRSVYEGIGEEMSRILATGQSESWAAGISQQLLAEDYDVIIIPYSQGGLYANEIFRLLSADERLRTRVLSIATPASTFLEENDYVNDVNDLIIAPVSALPANSFNVPDNDSVRDFLDLARRLDHSLIHDYLPFDKHSRAEISRKAQIFVDALGEN